MPSSALGSDFSFGVKDGQLKVEESSQPGLSPEVVPTEQNRNESFRKVEKARTETPKTQSPSYQEVGTSPLKADSAEVIPIETKSGRSVRVLPDSEGQKRTSGETSRIQNAKGNSIVEKASDPNVRANGSSDISEGSLPTKGSSHIREGPDSGTDKVQRKEFQGNVSPRVNQTSSKATTSQTLKDAPVPSHSASALPTGGEAISDSSDDRVPPVAKPSSVARFRWAINQTSPQTEGEPVVKEIPVGFNKAESKIVYPERVIPHHEDAKPSQGTSQAKPSLNAPDSIRVTSTSGNGLRNVPKPSSETLYEPRVQIGSIEVVVVSSGQHSQPAAKAESKSTNITSRRYLRSL